MSILHIEHLRVEFPIRRSLFGRVLTKLTAVDDISFDINQGEIIGIVGESGCGKSTLAKTLCGLIRPTAGSMVFDEKYRLDSFKSSRDWRCVRKDIQMIFQNPIASINPMKRVYDIIKEPLVLYNPNLSKSQIHDRVVKIALQVGINEFHLNKHSYEFSGGQCQRIGIARALICEPKLLICDEPVSALDVSIQAQVVNLIKSLQRTNGLTVMFIAHDLSVVKHISDRIFVMYLGNVVEIATKTDLYTHPKHPYTQSLLNAIPTPDCDDRYLDRDFLEGDIPSPINLPNGCPFKTRCRKASAECDKVKPTLRDVDNSSVACHLYGK